MSILSASDFTDMDVRNAVSEVSLSATNGDNLYLFRADQYYTKLLRDFSIDATDDDLSSPPLFDVKEVMILWSSIDVLKDLIDDSRAPFDNQQILVDKYSIKLRNAVKAHKSALGELDSNAFYSLDRSTDVRMVTRFGWN
jgi:hypothetical protein